MCNGFKNKIVKMGSDLGSSFQPTRKLIYYAFWVENIANILKKGENNLEL